MHYDEFLVCDCYNRHYHSLYNIVLSCYKEMAFYARCQKDYRPPNCQRGFPMQSTLMGYTVLIIDDDEVMSAMVAAGLSRAGANVFTAVDSTTGWQYLEALRPHLVIIDLLMPEVNGHQLCQRIRQHYQIPILILTSLSQNKEIIKGLRNGADDYVVKPVNLEVLAARIEALLRRPSLHTATNAQHSYQDTYLTIDQIRREVTVCQQPVKLSNTEYRLLILLLEHSNQVVAWQDILIHIWGPAYQNNPDYVHRYISYLRQKLEVNPRQPQYLITRRGVGYLFQTKTEARNKK
jgi:DNA-binding response OmpR family regulator